MRVQVANVGGRLVARPLTGAAGVMLTLPRANGIARPPINGPGGRLVQVDLFTDPSRLESTLVAVGCDPATSLLAEHLRRRHPTVELAWQGGNSLQARFIRGPGNRGPSASGIAMQVWPW